MDYTALEDVIRLIERCLFCCVMLLGLICILFSGWSGRDHYTARRKVDKESDGKCANCERIEQIGGVEVEVYIAFWDQHHDGNSEPVAVFSSEEKAEEWRCGQTQPTKSFDPIPEWTKLDVDEGCGCVVKVKLCNDCFVKACESRREASERVRICSGCGTYPCSCY